MWMLLHGFTGSPASWEQVVHAADLGPPPLIPWLFGHGLDWKDRAPATFDDEVDRLADLALATNAPRFLAGYSLGGRVGFALLARYRDLFHGAVLIGARPGLTNETERRGRAAQDAARAAKLREKGLPAFLDSWEQQPLFETQQSLPADAREAQRAIREGHEPEGLARSLEVLGLASMPTDRTGFGSTPVTFMAGERDPKFSAIARELAGSHRGARATIVDGAGHNLLLEAPRTVAEELVRIESEVSGG
jgi:2-succinyl-6-hydroxy-2,4-cyclohexadiene-1-carboxylate synthase